MRSAYFPDDDSREDLPTESKKAKKQKSEVKRQKERRVPKTHKINPQEKAWDAMHVERQGNNNIEDLTTLLEQEEADTITAGQTVPPALFVSHNLI